MRRSMNVSQDCETYKITSIDPNVARAVGLHSRNPDHLHDWKNGGLPMDATLEDSYAWCHDDGCEQLMSQDLDLRCNLSNQRLGGEERLASITGSILDRLGDSMDFDASALMTANSDSTNSLNSILKRTPLFESTEKQDSVKSREVCSDVENHPPIPPPLQFSNDSLDLSSREPPAPLNLNNYTLTFQESSSKTPEDGIAPGSIKMSEAGAQTYSQNLPDLDFLRREDNLRLRKSNGNSNRKKRPFSCNDLIEVARRRRSEIVDWSSLHFLLPKEVKEVIDDEICSICNNEENEKDRNSEEEEKEVNLEKVKKPCSHILKKRRSKTFKKSETLPEISELTKAISNNLEIYYKEVNIRQEKKANARQEKFFYSASTHDYQKGSRGSCEYDNASEYRSVTKHSNPKLYNFEHDNNLPKMNAQAKARCTSQQYQYPGPYQYTYSSCQSTNPNFCDCGIADHVEYHESRSNKSSQYKQQQLQDQHQELIPQQLDNAHISNTTMNLYKNVKSAILKIKKDQRRKKNFYLKFQDGLKEDFTKTELGALVYKELCPSLYALLSDGLNPFLNTIFGPVPNTLWRVIENSLYNGPSPQNLHELVLRINSEEEMFIDGPLKFNAFLCGLLNLNLLPTYLQLLRSKEKLLKTHYNPSSFLYNANTKMKKYFDELLAESQFFTCSFHYKLDIFHELKYFHCHILNVPEKVGNDNKAESHGKSSKKSKKIAENEKIKLNFKKFNKIQRSVSDESFEREFKMVKSKTSGKLSTENSGNAAGVNNGNKKSGAVGTGDGGNDSNTSDGSKNQNKTHDFQKLRKQWELYSSSSKSKIPRPISSKTNSGKK